MKRVFIFTIAMGLLAMAAPPAQAAMIELDISAGYNYDLYISLAERTEANSYNPPGDWGLDRRMVPDVFGQHDLGSRRTYAFQDQVTTGTALPADGNISHNGWTYQLSLNRDAEPVGGWGNPEIPPPTNPRGNLALQPNVVRADKNRTVDANQDPNTVATVVLPVSQQDLYYSINFLFAGNNKHTMIFADYADGQELLWEAPNIDGETGFPSGLSTSSPNPAIVAAYTTDRIWGQSGNYSDIRSEASTVWTFADPIDLDPTRTLTGFTLEVKGDDKWTGRTAFVLAASGDLVPEPATIALLGFGAMALLRRRS